MEYVLSNNGENTHRFLTFYSLTFSMMLNVIEKLCLHDC